MGAETIIGASLLAGSSIFGTLTSQSTNESNRDFSAEQSEEARKWSTNERLAAQEYQTQERLATQDYNSINNQVMQSRAAGLNPNAIGKGVSFVGSSPQASGPASAPMSGIGTAQVPNIPQLISSGADLVNALSKHKETKATLPLISEQVKNYMLQNFGQETTNKILDLEQQLKKSTLSTDIKMKFEELAKLGFDKMVSEQQGKKFEQETKLLNQQEDINNLIKGLKGEELTQAQYLTQRWNEIQNSVVALNKAKTNEAHASAANQRSQASQNEIFNKLYSDKRYQHSLVTQAVEAGRQAVQQTKISKSQAEHMTYLVEQAAYANDMKEFTYWSGQVNQFVNTLGSAASQFYGAGALRELIHIRQGQQVPPVSVQGFK